MISNMHDQLSPLFAGSGCFDLSVGEATFLRRAGRVQLQRHTPHGARLMLQNAGPGTVLAEASAFSERYYCDAVVTKAATLAALSKSAFLVAMRDKPELAWSWSAMLACSVQAARVRAETRSLPKVAERLDAWLNEGHSLPDKGHWQDVAAELGVTREALYRELARRRKGGGA